MVLSIISVNYNGFVATKQMVASLFSALRDVSFEWEIVVVDNGSESSDVEALRRLDGIVLVESKENLGFAGGNNLAFGVAKGRFIMLLNNDVEVRSDIFTPLIAFFESHPKCAVVSPKIVYQKDNKTIQFAGYAPCDPLMFNIKSVGCGATDCGQFEEATQTPFMHGAAALVSRKAIEECGLIDEDYFLYFEELDWSLQFTKKGYQIWYSPVGVVYHEGGHSTNKNSYSKIYYNSRNRLIFAAKNLNGTDRVRSIVMQLIFSVPKNGIKALISGDLGLCKAHLHGALDFLLSKSGKL